MVEWDPLARAVASLLHPDVPLLGGGGDFEPGDSAPCLRRCWLVLTLRRPVAGVTHFEAGTTFIVAGIPCGAVSAAGSRQAYGTHAAGLAAGEVVTDEKNCTARVFHILNLLETPGTGGDQIQGVLFECTPGMCSLPAAGGCAPVCPICQRLHALVRPALRLCPTLADTASQGFSIAYRKLNALSFGVGAPRVRWFLYASRIFDPRVALLAPNYRCIAEPGCGCSECYSVTAEETEAMIVKLETFAEGSVERMHAASCRADASYAAELATGLCVDVAEARQAGGAGGRGFTFKTTNRLGLALLPSGQ